MKMMQLCTLADVHLSCSFVVSPLSCSHFKVQALTEEFKHVFFIVLSLLVWCLIVRVYLIKWSLSVCEHENLVKLGCWRELKHVRRVILYIA